MSVVELPRPNRTNQSALEMAEALVGRIKSGEVLAIALVEVQVDRVVSTSYSHRESGTYHLLNSGAARLAHMLAGED